jgi:hypothetical protein
VTIVPSPAGIPAGSFSTSPSCSAAEALCRPSPENAPSTRIVPVTGTSLQEEENPTGREYNFSLSQKTSGGGLAESDSVNWPLINGYPEVMPLNKRSTMWARSPIVVSEATAEEELRSRENVWRSLLIQRLEGSRWRLRRTRSAMGFELDFGLEVS